MALEKPQRCGKCGDVVIWRWEQTWWWFGAGSDQLYFQPHHHLTASSATRCARGLRETIADLAVSALANIGKG